ncbi:lysosomal alpha-glucosidase [Trichonephila clavipes]|nr:lysosomal alpha-glucosidase [Trichonephila clavipes]
MEQKKDQDLAKLKLLSNSSKNEEFRFIDGILCRKNFDPDGKLWLPVIPKHLRADILRHFHDAPTAGHLGFAKTYDRIRKRFYWPGMYRNVVRYVMHCRECQRRKSVPQRPPGRLVPIPPAIAPFHRIGIDLLGRFPNRSKIAKFLLEEIVLRHGAPRVIITDRGAVFRSRLVSSLVDLCNIDHRFTTAYHPQTNGLTERFNKTLADMLSMYVDVEQKNWDEILPFVTFAYNTAKQETTGFTPFYLLHGREAETTLDTMLPFCPNDFDDNNITKIAARAEESRQLARVHTLRAQDKDRRRYDSKHQMVSYAPGDLVWVYTPEQDPAFLGPVVVEAAQKALEIRYTLLPYLYTLFARSHVFGDTVIRPLFFEFPLDKNTYGIDEQFMWGPAMMIVPGLYENATNVSAYIPEGIWFDSRGILVNSTGERISFPLGLTDIYISVRGGYILPGQLPNKNTELSRKEPFIITATLDENAQAKGELYWDDGDSLDTYVKGNYTLIRFNVDKNTFTSTIVNKGYDGPMDVAETQIAGLTMKPSAVSVNGVNCPFSPAENDEQEINLFIPKKLIEKLGKGASRDPFCVYGFKRNILGVGMNGFTLLSPLTINWKIINLQKNFGTVSPKRKSKCWSKCKTTPPTDKFLVRNSTMHPIKTNRDLQGELLATGVSVDSSAVRRRP